MHFFADILLRVRTFYYFYLPISNPYEEIYTHYPSCCFLINYLRPANIYLNYSVIKIGLNRPAELVLKENVRGLKELDVFFEGLHFGAKDGQQVFLSRQVLNRLGLEHTVEVSLRLAGVVDHSATFTAQMQH